MKQKTPLLFEKESYLIRGAVFEVYKHFRNTQKEVVYRNALAQELKKQGLDVEVEKRMPVSYGGRTVGTYVPDMVVNNEICIELKAKPFLHKEDKEQFWHYLKNSGFRLGFLVNFGAPDGVQIIRKVYDTARGSA
jgi:GxxExxY protein